jgi:FlaA1/EpsC-like NDP-sugar epimerase
MISIPANKPRTHSAPTVRMRYLMLIDLLLIWAAIIFAFVIRYEALISVFPFLRLSWTYFVLVPLIRLPVYFGFRLYYRLWRYASMKELFTIVLASAVGSALIFVANFLIFPLLGFDHMLSRSVWFAESVISFLFLGGSRFLLRMIQERYQASKLLRSGAFIPNPSRVLIAGAGDAGAIVLREMLSNSFLGYKVVGLVDDDPNKKNYSLYDVPVLGSRNDIPRIIHEYNVSNVIIAMPTAPGKDIREIVRICEEADIHPQTIPGIYELLDGSFSLNQVRNVDIEDLLRREPVVTDIKAVRDQLRGKRVLVTGGGGSIGSELCRQILRSEPSELILLGHGENSIFEISEELKIELSKVTRAKKPVLKTVIADVRFPERILRLFRTLQPEIVFHAAAHKHVPLMEDNPAEAITNNVLGTRNLLTAAVATNVSHFVMISSDKAVNPTSIMGASKRAAELLVHAAARQSKRPYVAVRFGNVLGSRGSVVLTFKKQIAAGGPITITDPKMQRFFMTIPEAVQLVLQSSVLGTGGEVFLLDMGEPVRIVDLAHDLIRLSGLQEGRDIDIVFTGLRPGEKLFEELFVQGEKYERTKHDKIYIAANASSFIPDNLDASIVSLEQAAQDDDRTAILRNLQNLIPEYRPNYAGQVPEITGDAPPPHPELHPVPQ